MAFKALRTVLTAEDQGNLLKFLQSDSGKKIQAWLYENQPASLSPVAAPEHAMVWSDGKKAGYEEALYRLRQIPVVDLRELNESMGDDDNG